LGQPQKDFAAYVTTLQSDVDIVLRKSWLSHHNPKVDWKAKSVLFNSKFCQEDCLQTSGAGISAESYPRHLDIAFVSDQAFRVSVKSPSSQLYAVTLKEVSYTLTTKLQANYVKLSRVTSQDLGKQILRNEEYDPVQERGEIEKIIPYFS
jgi:hypothetical protein